MSTSDTATAIRIHIGNISPKLRGTGDVLASRLAKFGNLLSPLEYHSKPVGDFYFAYAVLEIDEQNFEKLKNALNGIMYMGRKISIALAKASYEQKWTKDQGRPSPSTKKLQNKAGISRSRSNRLEEASTLYPSNSVTGVPVAKTSIIGANNSALGYLKSVHTFQNISGNTKNKNPSQSLVGPTSYGSTLVGKSIFTRQYSRMCGNGETVPGRIRKTTRPASHFARKEQTVRILINGELKQIKCYKTKLWGVDQKSATELTYTYKDGAWKSGDDHVVERSMGTKRYMFECGSLTINKCSITGDQAQNYGVEAIFGNNSEITKPDEISNLIVEQKKNAAIVAKMFTSFDFDKEAELEAEDALDADAVTYDSKGRKTVEIFDFETQGALVFSGSDHEDERIDEDDGAPIEVVKKFVSSHERPPEEVYYSDGDEGNEIDMDELQRNFTTEGIKSQYDEEHGLGSEDISLEDHLKTTSQISLDGEKETAVKKKEEIMLESKDEEEVGSSKQESSDSDSSQKISSSDDESSSSGDERTSPDDESSSDDKSSSSDDDSSSSDEASSSSKKSTSLNKDGELNNNEEPKDQKQSEVDQEDLVPKLGAPAQTSATTESLRSLFNQESREAESTTFSLAVDEDDIDEESQALQEEERQKLVAQIKEKQEQVRELQEQAQNKNKRKFGLFWAHLDSPFLQTQTQLSKIGYPGQKYTLPGEEDDESLLREHPEGENDDYEKWFWSKRSEVHRECKKQRREAVKFMERKNAKAYL